MLTKILSGILAFITVILTTTSVASLPAASLTLYLITNDVFVVASPMYAFAAAKSVSDVVPSDLKYVFTIFEVISPSTLSFADTVSVQPSKSAIGTILSDAVITGGVVSAATVKFIVYVLVVVPSSAVTTTVVVPGKLLASVTATVAFPVSFTVASTVGTAVVPIANSTL